MISGKYWTDSVRRTRGCSTEKTCKILHESACANVPRWVPRLSPWSESTGPDGQSGASSKDQADRKAGAREELEAIMREPKRAPSREVWMHESLVDEARRLWEPMVTDLNHSLSDQRST